MRFGKYQSGKWDLGNIKVENKIWEILKVVNEIWEIKKWWIMV